MEHQCDIETASALHEVRTLRDDSNPSSLDRYRQDLERAILELEEEKHKPLGFVDDMLNLLCFIETPEERLHKNRLALFQLTMPETGRSHQQAATPHGIIGTLATRIAFAVAKVVS